MGCAIEPRFFKVLLEKLGVDEIEPTNQFDQARWTSHIAIFEKVFAAKTRDEWTEILADSDACFAPVLSLAEAPNHHHNQARKTFVEVNGVVQPAPAPRFSRTPLAIRSGAGEGETDIQSVIDNWGNGSAN